MHLQLPGEGESHAKLDSLPMTSSLHHHQVDEVLLCSHQIDELVGSLETCEYRQPKFREVLDKLQKMIDDLNLRSYSNLSQWVAELDRQVCGVGDMIVGVDKQVCRGW